MTNCKPIAQQNVGEYAKEHGIDLHEDKKTEDMKQITGDLLAVAMKNSFKARNEKRN